MNVARDRMDDHNAFRELEAAGTKTRMKRAFQLRHNVNVVIVRATITVSDWIGIGRDIERRWMA